MSLADVNDEQEQQAEDAVEDEAQEQGEQSQDEQAGEGAEGQEAESEGVVVSIGDESPPSEETEQRPELVPHLRKTIREKDRELRELRAEREAAKAPKAAEVGAKPTLAECDYDEEAFEQKLTAWHGRKAEADRQARKQQEAQQEALQAFEARKTAYGTAKAALKVQDFEDAEATVIETLDPMQQTILITGAENSALLVYALGKNPAEAKKLASIKDSVQFAFAAARLENKLKVTPRKAAPLPESTVRGTAPVRSSDQNLARLEAEAEKTGDRTKLVAWKKAQKLKAA